jgi:hypothetical protein
MQIKVELTEGEMAMACRYSKLERGCRGQSDIGCEGCAFFGDEEKLDDFVTMKICKLTNGGVQATPGEAVYPLLDNRDMERKEFWKDLIKLSVKGYTL